MNGKVAATSNKVSEDIELDNTKLTALTDSTKSVQYANGELAKQPASSSGVDANKDGVFVQTPVLIENPPGSGKYDVQWGWRGPEAVVTIGITTSSGEGVGVGNGVSAAGGSWGSGLSLPAGSYVVKLVASNGQSSTSVASIKSSSSLPAASTSVQPGAFTQAPSVFESPPGSGKFDVRWGWSGTEANVSVSLRSSSGAIISSAAGLSAKGGYWGPGLSLVAGDYTVMLTASNGEKISAVSTMKLNTIKNTTTVPRLMTTTTATPGEFTASPSLFESPPGSGKYDVRWAWSGGAESMKAKLLNASGQEVASATLSVDSKVWGLGISLAPGTYTINIRASLGASTSGSSTISASSTTTSSTAFTTSTTSTTPSSSVTSTTVGSGVFTGSVRLVESPAGSGKFDAFWQWSGSDSTVTAMVRDGQGFERSRAGLTASSGRWSGGFSLVQGRTYTVSLNAANGESSTTNVTVP
jgi:hypothetical protein